MNAPTTKAGPKQIKAGETLLCGIDAQFFGLASGVTLSSPTSYDADGLTIASLAVNTATFINDKEGTCPIGKGIQFLASGAVAGTTYDLKFTAATSNGQTIRLDCTLVGVA